MKQKRKMSHREVWLVSLLPAALVVIVSMAVPGPAGEISEVERRLDRLTGDSQPSVQSQLRESRAQLDKNRDELSELESREADIQSRIEALQAPLSSRAYAMAEALDELAHRLAARGVRVLAVVEGGGSSGGGGNSGGGGDSGGGGARGGPQDWRISVAATWPAVREALADGDSFPQGLALSALKMDPPRENVPLRRWELIVTEAGAAP